MVLAPAQDWWMEPPRTTFCFCADISLSPLCSSSWIRFTKEEKLILISKTLSIPPFIAAVCAFYAATLKSNLYFGWATFSFLLTIFPTILDRLQASQSSITSLSSSPPLSELTFGITVGIIWSGLHSHYTLELTLPFAVTATGKQAPIPWFCLNSLLPFSRIPNSARR